VKILDFGLAKTTADGAAACQVHETHSLLTQAGAIIGTAPYMSPEQVKGQALDARSDIFSFGTVLHELLSGHRPFGAGTFAETISAVLTRDPPPLAAHGIAAPAGIERVIGQCLQKNRDQRYQTMREVRLELESERRALGSGGVIPGSSRDEPLSSRLATARSGPTGGFRPTNRVVLAAAVGAVVVAAATYAGLKKPSQGESVGSAQATAYDLYLRGKVYAGSENRDNNDTAIKLLTQAVAADPAFAPAYAQLARAYNVKAFYYAPDAEKKTADRRRRGRRCKSASPGSQSRRRSPRGLRRPKKCAGRRNFPQFTRRAPSETIEKIRLRRLRRLAFAASERHARVVCIPS
jgi:hypothetical protein